MPTEAARSLAAAVGDALRDSDEMVAVAESSTGGLLGSTLTDVPGSSSYFERGLITYSNATKTELLDVDPATIDNEGAVSPETARQMATGVRSRSGTDWGISTTGIAGPGGGTSHNPVGTVYIGIAGPIGDGETVSVNHYEFDGDRHENKADFTRQALTDLLDALE